MRRASAAAGLLLLTAASALAQAQHPTTFGAGSTLCSRYTKAARSSDILYHQASSWLLGYVSGLGEASRASGRASPFDGLNTAQVLRTVAEYCEANPTSTIASATNLWRTATAPAPAAPPQASTPQQAAAPQAATPQTEAKKDDGDWIKLRLVAPERKPLLDRR